MGVRKLWRAVAVVTLTAGVGSANWRDPDTIRAASPTQLELAYVPDCWFSQRTVAGASEGFITIATPTVNVVTVSSSDGGDTGTVRVWAIVRFGDEP